MPTVDNIFERGKVVRGLGLFDLFKKKTKSDRPRPATRNVLNLEVNDIVTYDLEDYIVVGKIAYNDSGYEWHDYQLKGDRRRIWLSAEQDDELEIAVYEKIQTKLSTPIPDELEIDGVRYHLEEHGFANVTHVSGEAGASVGQNVEYWDFESEDERYLSVEKWGGQIEVSKGYPITEKEINILAGS